MDILKILGAILLFGCSGVFGQSSMMDTTTWVTDGDIKVIASTGAAIYFAGQFTAVGPYSGSFVPVDSTTAEIPLSFGKTDGSEAIAVAPDGSGGHFVANVQSVNGVSVNRLAHILADGTLDTNFAPNPDSDVLALAVSSTGVLYVGGLFSTIGGQSRSYLAAVDTATGNALAWDPEPDDEVFTLNIDSAGIVYAGGDFTTLNSGAVARNWLAAIDPASGVPTAWDPEPDSEVYAIEFNGGLVYIGGQFNNVGGQARTALAAIDVSGVATAWDPEPDSSVFSIQFTSQVVYLGGEFSSLNGGSVSRDNLGAVDIVTGAATAWAPSTDGSVQGISLGSDSVFAAGGFRNANGEVRNCFAAFDYAGDLASWNPRVPYGIQTCFGDHALLEGTTVYLAGYFYQTNALDRYSAAALDPLTGELLDWNPSFTLSGNPFESIVDALAVSSVAVYAGGQFTTAGGLARTSLACLDPLTGAPSSWSPDLTASGRPEGFSVQLSTRGTLYVGGDFTGIAGVARNRLAEVDLATGAATAWNPDANGVVRTLAVNDGGVVYAGGEFTSVSGVARNRAAAIDASAALQSWNPNSNNLIRTLVLSTSAVVYAGGSFSSIGGQSRSRIAALDGTSGNATSWAPNATGGDVFIMAVSSYGTVFTGGNFTAIGGFSRAGAAELDAGTGSATPWSPALSGANHAVESLLIEPSWLYVGGGFKNSLGFENLARFSR